MARDELLDHEYDGIQEYDNPCPGWWHAIFWLTVLFSAAYFLFFQVGSRILISRMLTGQFPNYEAVLPRDNTKIVEMDKDKTAAAIRRVALLADERSHAIRMQVEKDRIEVFSSSGEYGEAHEVLEELWLQDKHGPNGAFYKGLIQLAGAFVHLQKNRPQPAAALFKLALANLEKYPAEHERLDVATVCGLIRNWLGSLEAAHFEKNPFTGGNAPKLALDLPHTQI